METMTTTNRGAMRASRGSRKTHRVLHGRRTQRNGSLRSRVAAAFRRMANGVTQGAAYASTVRFYQSSGYDWARGWDERRIALAPPGRVAPA